MQVLINPTSGVKPRRRPIDLVGQLLQSECAWLESSFQIDDAPMLETLQQAGAVIRGHTNSAMALCGFCGLEYGPISREANDLTVQCPDCGPYPLDPANVRTWRLSEEWLIRRLRGALDIPPHMVAMPLADGIWEIGRYRKRAVLLVRNLERAMRNGLLIFHNAPERSNAWIISPRPCGPLKEAPFAGVATWWPLEDRFALHGMALRLLGDASEQEGPSQRDATVKEAIHGPFSADFGWVHLEGWPEGPIRLTGAQAQLFGALWRNRHKAQPAEVLMRDAGLTSERPIDVFKVKAANKGDPAYEGPLQAYERLVVRQKRLGLYQLKLSA